MVYTNTGKIMSFVGTFSIEGKLFKSTFYSNTYDKTYVKSKLVHKIVYKDIIRIIKIISYDEDRFTEMIKKNKSKKLDENEIYRVIKKIDVEFQMLFKKQIGEEIDDIQYELEKILKNEL